MNDVTLVHQSIFCATDLGGLFNLETSRLRNWPAIEIVPLMLPPFSTGTTSWAFAMFAMFAIRMAIAQRRAPQARPQVPHAPCFAEARMSIPSRANVVNTDPSRTAPQSRAQGHVICCATTS